MSSLLQHAIDPPAAEALAHDKDVVTRLTFGCTASDSLESGLTVAVCTYKRADSLARFLDSLRTQDRTPDQLVIVDASPDDGAEQIVRDQRRPEELARCVMYFRVRGALDTLTCSRNFALRQVRRDLVVYFDDDVVLRPGCLREMEAPMRSQGEEVVGIGAYVDNDTHGLNTLWRLRRLLWIVPHLRPGRYLRSGMATPWRFLSPTEKLVEGDWLSGCGMMWRTGLALQIGFNEGFGGHSMGEDLDFGLQMARHGKVFVQGKAHMLHLEERAGRPNTFVLGYTGMRNAHSIHKKCLTNRTRRDAVWFVYAYAMDSLVRGASLIRPGSVNARFRFLLGRLRYFMELPWVK